MISKFSILRLIVCLKHWLSANKTEILGMLGLCLSVGLIFAGVAFDSYLLRMLGAIVMSTPILMMVYEVAVHSLWTDGD